MSRLLLCSASFLPALCLVYIGSDRDSLVGVREPVAGNFADFRGFSFGGAFGCEVFEDLDDDIAFSGVGDDTGGVSDDDLFQGHIVFNHDISFSSFLGAT